MAIVAGIDFGTLSVRASIFDSERGRLASATAEYPLLRKKEDPDHAAQRYQDHMEALVAATHKALREAGVAGHEVVAMALDTTGSSVIPVSDRLVPLDDYYLWCDHRARQEAALITKTAHQEGLEAINWCGGAYSSEWGFSKLLHWIRHNPNGRERLATALEHCDMVAAVLCGIHDVAQLPRSICAMGHKWMWNEELGGLPPEDFLVKVDPVFRGVRAKLAGRYATSDKMAGRLSSEWAEKLGLKAGIPVPVGALDAHWDAIGAGIREGDVVNVVGTSTCIMAIARQLGLIGDSRPNWHNSPGKESHFTSVRQKPASRLIPGVCGVVKGSIHPGYWGIEAGLSATGDIFDAIARRASTSVAELSKGLDKYRAGQTGLLRLAWDNGDRTVLVNPNLGGVTLGWHLSHTAQDELFAAIEGTAFHTRVILERMAEHGVPIRRIINGGGIPQKNEKVNRVYASVLNKPVLVPESEVTSLGSAIFAFLAAGVFQTVEEAQEKLCPKCRAVEPDPRENAAYEKLYPIFQKLYFALGAPGSHPINIGEVLPTLGEIAVEVRQSSAP